ncbi:hypothetical protein [Demequina sp. NBRC 110054]|uniref:lipase family alpha/beta hydrolase n=1 Tax=Demequina sp. NBRC 110054 TaxID=1570343 RepID=UPI0009FFE53E|nr:hypothetical protein [Demequina sp. NBRC 110054]
MTPAARSLRPLILIRGFGGTDLSDDQASPYQGFNEGTAYPGRKGDNYIYEGFVLRALKSPSHPYRDATNVAGYYARAQVSPPDLGDLDAISTSGTVVLDPAVERRVLAGGTAGTIWVYRYYDLSPRTLEVYGAGLKRLVDLIEASAARRGEDFRGVDIVAHSMGGLVAREGVIAMGEEARDRVHRIVTLGTPHRGIAFQQAPDWLLKALPKVKDAGHELEAFDPDSVRFREWRTAFDPSRVLTVVGTDFRSYNVGIASALNRVASLLDEGTLAYNRSDGLVKHASAQLPGSPRTFVHKCHGGRDSLVTSREAYEIAMRFLHGSHRVSLLLDRANIKRGKDWFGRSEFFFGVSIRPRNVDFDLFHQSVEAQNCYGPFRKVDLSDGGDETLEDALFEPLAAFGDGTNTWAGDGRLIWEGWIDTRAAPADGTGMVFRLDVYVSERDSYGLGFSDNVVFHKQYLVQVFPGSPPGIFVHTGERHFASGSPSSLDQLREEAGVEADCEVQRAQPVEGEDDAWTFEVAGTGFDGRFRIRIESEDSGDEYDAVIPA